MKFPARIRLYPEPYNSRRYVLVYIWPTTKMIRHLARTVGARYTKKAKDSAIAYTAPPSIKKTGKIAVIHFCKPYLDIRIIGHEISHAAFTWFRHARSGRGKEVNMMKNIAANKTKLDTMIEEVLCDGIGHMTEQLVSRLQRMKWLSA